MIRIVEAREHYELRKEQRPKQRFRMTARENPDGTVTVLTKEWVKGVWSEPVETPAAV